MELDGRPRIIHADHVVPGDVAPLRDGAIVVESGRVLDVGPAGSLLPRHAGAPIERVSGVVFPGLVNAHTHVELSALRGKLSAGQGFVGWVDRLVTTRSEIALEETSDAITSGVADLERAATVAVGDVTNSLASVRSLAERGIVGSIFHEVFGIDPAAVERRMDGLRAEVEEHVPSWPRELTYAPAPHTLYTLHLPAVESLLERARGTLTSLHLAEHPAERRAIEQGDGPVPAWFASRLKQSHVWPRRPLFDVAFDVGALRAGVLLVHLAEARPEELARVASSGASTVLCPRSNLFIENRLPPLLAMREAGIEPALGTDSLASNTSLDVLAEARALADRFSRVPAWELVRMATWNGARALGREELGRIARGARPGVFAIDLPDAADQDGATLLLRHLRAPRRRLVPHHSRVSS